MKALKAGAGKARMVFPEGYYPHEGYFGEYSPMHVRALVLEQRERSLLLSVELPSIRPFELTDMLRAQAAQLAGAPVENVWLCMTHSLSAPHVPPQKDGLRFDMHISAVKKAIFTAVESAISDLRPAVLRRGETQTDINVDREIESVDGWWMGLRGDSPVDNTLTVLRFDDIEGKPIALVYNHPMKSCVLETTVMSDGRRYASSDLCGAVSALAEAHYGAPALFFMGAGGDSFPKMKGNYLALDEDGHFKEINHGEAAYDFLRQLSEEVWQALYSCAENSAPCPNAAVVNRSASVTVPGQKPYPRETLPPPPVRGYVFEADEPQTVEYSLLQLGDSVILGVKPEVSYPLMTKLREGSPYKFTLLFSMVNGGQAYIPEERQLQRLVHPAIVSSMGSGSAAAFAAGVIPVLNEMYSNDPSVAENAADKE